MTMKAYKGFNKDMTCRGFQYEEGKSYETDTAELCESGFHACEYPLDCFGYYEPGESVYHEVELEEVSDERENDTKVTAKKIKIGARLSFLSALNGGDMSALNGGYMSVIYGGEGSRVKGGMHSVLAIQYWKDDKFQRIVFAEVDGEKYKADTWYTLNEDGEMVEAEGSEVEE